MRLLLSFVILVLSAFVGASKPQPKPVKFYSAADERFVYTGRVDFSDRQRPRFWAAGVYIQAQFQGSWCDIIVNDEMPGGSHNYLEIVVDGTRKYRVQLKGKTDTVRLVRNLANKPHVLTVCKNTEGSIGYLEFVGLRCENLLAAPPQPERRLEFIGNSITCGSASDDSEIPCGKGQWYDQHNAYLSYGPRVARKLNSQWHLTSYSGIGLIHSCCKMKMTMPQLFDKVNLRQDSIAWDFNRYQPDAVTVCLGQNDGKQDSAAFCSAYVDFIGKIRQVYPDAEIVCLSSPMADEGLNAVLKNYLTGVVAFLNDKGDKRVHRYFYSKRYNHGCADHPNLKEHEEMAGELAGYLGRLLNWRI